MGHDHDNDRLELLDHEIEIRILGQQGSGFMDKLKPREQGGVDGWWFE